MTRISGASKCLELSDFERFASHSHECSGSCRNGYRFPWTIYNKHKHKKAEYRRCAKNVEVIEQELKTRGVVEHQRWDQHYGMVISLIHDSGTTQWTKMKIYKRKEKKRKKQGWVWMLCMIHLMLNSQWWGALRILLCSDIILPIWYSWAISVGNNSWLVRNNTLMLKNFVYGQEETNVALCRSSSPILLL